MKRLKYVALIAILVASSIELKASAAKDEEAAIIKALTDIEREIAENPTSKLLKRIKATKRQFNLESKERYSEWCDRLEGQINRIVSYSNIGADESLNRAIAASLADALKPIPILTIPGLIIGIMARPSSSIRSGLLTKGDEVAKIDLTIEANGTLMESLSKALAANQSTMLASQYSLEVIAGVTLRPFSISLAGPNGPLWPQALIKEIESPLLGQSVLTKTPAELGLTQKVLAKATRCFLICSVS